MRRLPIERDAALICAAAFLRSSTVGLVGVVLAIYLADAGLTTTAIGLVIASGMAGGAAATLFVGVWADRLGRRRMLIALAIVSGAGCLSLATASRPATLITAAFLGMVNGMGRDRGAASALEQAILPESTGPLNRTWVLAWYNLVLDAGHAAGALAAAAPTVFARTVHADFHAAHQATFALCAAALVMSAAPYAAMGPGIEIPSRRDARSAVARLDPQSKRLVTRLTLLFGLDSIGGGFLNSALIAYWFFQRHGTSEGQLALLLFAARTLNAVSHVAAAWVARRVGLINTMVLTHLPSSLLLMLAPAAGSATVAGSLFLAREALVEMDVPTRQSYVMALVRPGERTLASSLTNVTRNTGWALGPALAGVLMQRVALAGPLLIGCALKITYDLALYASFRRVRPPEE